MTQLRVHRTASVIVAFFLLIAFTIVNGDLNRFDVQDTFHVTVVGSFRQDTPTTCDYCDCSEARNCSWVDNASCPGLDIILPDDNQQRWGLCDPSWGVICNCFQSSGVGFRGVSNVTIISNPANSSIGTLIGRMTHYNNPIAGYSPTQLRLTINMAAPELSQPFVISYPLDFIETPNYVGDIAACDPVLQKSNVPCDDHFSFTQVVLTDTFTKGNIEYTLQIVGFMRADSDVPIRGFITTESNVTSANIYAKIVTACIETTCGPLEVFKAPPVCGCVCAVSDEMCVKQNNGNPYWRSLNDTCGCECTLTAADCPANTTYNATSCSCGCPLTNTECGAQNSDFVVSPDPTLCGCVCSAAVVSACEDQGRFWTANTGSCACECIVTDALCEKTYGSGHSADLRSCTCASGGGLSGGEIAGIVVGAVVGALTLACLFAALAGLLAFLIRQGSIPGIYGVRIDAATFEGASESPLYHDPWKANENLLRSG